MLVFELVLAFELVSVFEFWCLHWCWCFELELELAFRLGVVFFTWCSFLEFVFLFRVVGLGCIRGYRLAAFPRAAARRQLVALGSTSTTTRTHGT